MNFDLNNDGSFTAVDFPDDAAQAGFGVVTEGNGHWSVEDCKLTVTTTHVWIVAAWKVNQVTWIPRVQVKSASGAEVELEGLHPLRRRQ